jgi:hypothetical protein
MSKLFVKPTVYKESFNYGGKTYYLTLSNTCLVSHIRLETYLPIFYSRNNFREVISKKEYKEVKKAFDNRFALKVKKHIQLTLF